MDASQKISEQIASLGDWRGQRMAEVRKLIHQALPKVEETWKWMGSGCYEQGGLICVMNPHKGVVRITFLHGAALPDPKKVFNAELEGNARRAIKLTEKDKLNAAAFKALVKAG